MEHLWSPAGATGGNPWQLGKRSKPLEQADPQPVATQRNGSRAHGKKGVDRPPNQHLTDIAARAAP
jgi:hypothetical protein